MQLAATLAAHQEEDIQQKHILQVLRIHEDFTYRELVILKNICIILVAERS